MGVRLYAVKLENHKLKVEKRSVKHFKMFFKTMIVTLIKKIATKCYLSYVYSLTTVLCKNQAYL